MGGQLLSNRARWRWAIASQIGTSHRKLGTRKQDALKCFVTKDVSSALCAIVCDGAGSAQFGGEGASLVCHSLSLMLRSHFSRLANMPTDDDVWGWLDVIRERLAAAAERRSVDRRAFASTLVLLVRTSAESLVVHVGDGAVVGRSETGEWLALSWPENGEYASTTYFVTDNPIPKMRIGRFFEDYDAYAIFSDGIEDLALNNQTKAPHGPFFHTMFDPLDAIFIPGKNTELSNALAAFLDSSRVCDRTDDDKSLILTSNR